jgi:hypothetical protein
MELYEPRTETDQSDLSENRHNRFASRGRGTHGRGSHQNIASRYSRFNDEDSDFEERKPISNAWATVTPESLLSWKDFVDIVDQKPSTASQSVANSEPVTNSQPVTSSQPITNSQPVASSEPIISSQSVASLEPTTNLDDTQTTSNATYLPKEIDISVADSVDNTPIPTISAWGSIKRREEACDNVVKIDEPTDETCNWGKIESNDWKKQSWDNNTTNKSTQNVTGCTTVGFTCFKYN